MHFSSIRLHASMVFFYEYTSEAKYSTCIVSYLKLHRHGGLVVSTFASHLQGWGFDSRLHLGCVEFACSPRASGVSSGYSGFLPRSKDMHGRLIGISGKLSVVCECVSE